MGKRVHHWRRMRSGCHDAALVYKDLRHNRALVDVDGWFIRKAIRQAYFRERVVVHSIRSGEPTPCQYRERVAMGDIVKAKIDGARPVFRYFTHSPEVVLSHLFGLLKLYGLEPMADCVLCGTEKSVLVDFDICARIKPIVCGTCEALAMKKHGRKSGRNPHLAVSQLVARKLIKGEREWT